jgi:hypothetical protein
MGDIIEFLCEAWHTTPVELLKAASMEYKRLKEKGLIFEYRTWGGTIMIMKHPLLKRGRE